LGVFEGVGCCLGSSESDISSASTVHGGGRKDE
jgi:hypothetical protein